ncbi:apocytochrome f [Synechococcales cyanobacterium C]|uniref:Cytochrome f n=1 Tax=Petrachloros mirabilis ULC683 TaxID=2781853 RepID=A0A8K2A741_9CYAN|nr:apocytochrome f [Petrachloros mirabilis]NCJ06486.1 apocytochrome f [Petrachloros mirabilis ULC683]
MKRSLLSVFPRQGLSWLAALLLFLGVSFALPQPAQAYPVYAQQAYENPREPTGRIVCANCHLGAKPTEVEVPQSVLPDTVFKAVVKIPYDTNVQQVLGNGEKGPLNVGALLMLPEGFKIAPQDRIPEDLKEEVGGVYFQPYSPEKDNWVVVGPLPGEQYQEIVFPVLSPDPGTDKNLHFGKYSVHVGGNRGRGQVYPTGDPSNNSAFAASVSGIVTDIVAAEAGGYEITIAPPGAEKVTQTIPAGPELLISKGEKIQAGALLTNNPNVGGFGQIDAEVVLQNPTRIKWLIAFFAAIMLSQTLLVLKKKQFEKVQAAEMNF